MADTPNKNPWLVGMHYRMRTVAFAMMFVASALHSTGKSYSPGLWSLLVLLFLIYPHLQYYRACRARKPLEADEAVRPARGGLLVEVVDRETALHVADLERVVDGERAHL